MILLSHYQEFELLRIDDVTNNNGMHKLQSLVRVIATAKS